MTSLLLQDLVRTADRAGRAGHSLLVCRRYSEGRELLRSLALEDGGWVGLEPVTPVELSARMAAPGMAADEVHRADQLDLRALLDEVIDRVLGAGAGAVTPDLAARTGFREAIAGAVTALRIAGVDPERVRSARTVDAERRLPLARVLAEYTDGLRERGWADEAEVLNRALRACREGSVEVPGERVLLLPGQRMRGLRGELLGLLRDAGARVLATDPVVGEEPPAAVLAGPEVAPAGRLSWLLADEVGSAPAEPEIHLFSAASPMDEIREVLRRVVGSEHAWDEVEIVATDPVAYGAALDALARRLEIEVTYAAGLPVTRTRPGRAVAAYLRWLEEGFPADLVCDLLRSGALSAGAAGEDVPTDTALARRLRSLSIGWGRDRYLRAIRSALSHLDRDGNGGTGDAPAVGEDASSGRRRELLALDDLFGRILEATPEIGRGPDGEPVTTSAAEIARGLLAFLDFVPADAPAERKAHERLTSRLERAAETLERRTGFGAALADLKPWLDLRVGRGGEAEDDGAPARSEGDAFRRAGASPLRGSTGGRLHLSDLKHGGMTGRPMTFIVGLDADQFPGSDRQHPILLDGDRRRIAREDLPTSGDRLAEKRHGLASLLARLRGRVTLSYSSWESSEGQTVPPASILLHAFRLQQEDPGAGYGDLHDAIGRPVGAIPWRHGPLDATDVWLDALTEDGVLLRGTGAVRAAHPDLDRGLRARTLRESAAVTAHRGGITPRPELDPRDHPDVVVSASRMELLGRCPLAYFYRRVLKISAPDDPERDLTAWLDARDRGSLLHAVFEHTLREAREREVAYETEAFEELAYRVLRREADRMRRRVPPPSEFTFISELERLRDDVRIFVRSVREESPSWLELEMSFGYSWADHPPVEVDLPGGTLRVGGVIDRVDELENGELRVVDYKTGGFYGHGRGDPFDGGRRVQHLLYSEAAEALLGRAVRRMEYRFPTVRGRGQAAPYPKLDLTEGPRLLDSLLDQVAEGTFVPTPDASDCKFCDFKEICGATEGEYGRMRSPPAAWGKRNAPDLPEYAAIREARGMDP